jgi:hypothetical protein
MKSYWVSGDIAPRTFSPRHYIEVSGKLHAPGPGRFTSRKRAPNTHRIGGWDKERLGQEAVVTSFKVLSRILLWRSDKTKHKTAVKTPGRSTEVCVRVCACVCVCACARAKWGGELKGCLHFYTGFQTLIPSLNEFKYGQIFNPRKQDTLFRVIPTPNVFITFHI